MLSGAPEAARWLHASPRHAALAPLAERAARAALPSARIFHLEPLTDGLRNANFKVVRDHPCEPLVVRIYEHDPSLCRKELDLFTLVASSVPVPEVIHAEPEGWEGIPPFMVTRFIEGPSFRELKRRGDAAAIAQAARSAGETLAAIGRFQFARPGWIAPGLTVTGPLLEGANAMPRFVDLCLESPRANVRIPADLRARIHRLVWEFAGELAALEGESSLAHGDFGKRNLLVRRVDDRWAVAAVLDWEFAVAGTPLTDLGHFLRYERDARPLLEPHFSAGYRSADATLPPDWRRFSRIVDLAALCESLTHEALPDEVIAELVELIAATAENRDPNLA